MTYPADALEALRNNQRQLDQDGCFVGVSRQALDEALAYIEELEWSRLTFTDEEDVLNGQEGWGIFETSGSENGPYQLQRFDEEAILADDTAAWMLVWNSPLPRHKKALEFLKRYSPAEYEAIENYMKGVHT